MGEQGAILFRLSALVGHATDFVGVNWSRAVQWGRSEIGAFFSALFHDSLFHGFLIVVITNSSTAR